MKDKQTNGPTGNLMKSLIDRFLFHFPVEWRVLMMSNSRLILNKRFCSINFWVGQIVRSVINSLLPLRLFFESICFAQDQYRRFRLHQLVTHEVIQQKPILWLDSLQHSQSV